MPLLSLSLAALLAAPGPSYRIVGVLRDRDGEPVAGALVVAWCRCLDGERTVTSRPSGAYVFSNLPAGDYVVSAMRGSLRADRYVHVGP